MARILIGVMPFAGHVAPISALVERLIDGGHRVRVYTGKRYRSHFETLGAHVIVWKNAPDFDEHDLRATFPALPKHAGPLATLANLEHIFVRSAAGQAADLGAAYKDEQWDVMAGDQLCLGLALAGELIGCPWASVSLVPLSLPSAELPPPGLALRPGRGRLGRLRDRLLRGVFSVATARLQRAYEQTRAGAGLPSGTARLESAWWSPFLICAVGVPALEYPRTDLPAQVHFVGALTSRGMVPGAVPESARVAAVLPYAELLGRTAVMITNGGWGGVLAALGRGVPLIVAGGEIDKPEIAARVAASGAGLDLRTGRPRPARIAKAYEAITRDPRFAERAGEIALELAGHDGTAEVAALLERLCFERRPITRAVKNPWGATSVR